MLARQPDTAHWLPVDAVAVVANQRDADEAKTVAKNANLQMNPCSAMRECEHA